MKWIALSLATIFVIWWFTRTEAPVDFSCYEEEIEMLEYEIEVLSGKNDSLCSSLTRIDTVYITKTEWIKQLSDEEAKEAVIDEFGEEVDDKTILLLNVENKALKQRETVLMELIDNQISIIAVKDKEIATLKEMNTLTLAQMDSLQEEIAQRERELKFQRNLAIIGVAVVLIITI